MQLDDRLDERNDRLDERKDVVMATVNSLVALEQQALAGKEYIRAREIFVVRMTFVRELLVSGMRLPH